MLRSDSNRRRNIYRRRLAFAPLVGGEMGTLQPMALKQAPDVYYSGNQPNVLNQFSRRQNPVFVRSSNLKRGVFGKPQNLFHEFQNEALPFSGLSLPYEARGTFGQNQEWEQRSPIPLSPMCRPRLNPKPLPNDSTQDIFTESPMVPVGQRWGLSSNPNINLLRQGTPMKTINMNHTSKERGQLSTPVNPLEQYLVSFQDETTPARDRFLNASFSNLGSRALCPTPDVYQKNKSALLEGLLRSRRLSSNKKKRNYRCVAQKLEGQGKQIKAEFKPSVILQGEPMKNDSFIKSWALPSKLSPTLESNEYDVLSEGEGSFIIPTVDAQNPRNRPSYLNSVLDSDLIFIGSESKDNLFSKSNVNTEEKNNSNKLKVPILENINSSEMFKSQFYMPNIAKSPSDESVLFRRPLFEKLTSFKLDPNILQTHNFFENTCQKLIKKSPFLKDNSNSSQPGIVSVIMNVLDQLKWTSPKKAPKSKYIVRDLCNIDSASAKLFGSDANSPSLLCNPTNTAISPILGIVSKKNMQKLGLFKSRNGNQASKCLVRPSKILNNSLLTPQKKSNFKVLEQIRSKSQAKYNSITKRGSDFKPIKEVSSGKTESGLSRPVNVALFPIKNSNKISDASYSSFLRIKKTPKLKFKLLDSPKNQSTLMKENFTPLDSFHSKFGPSRSRAVKSPENLFGCHPFDGLARIRLAKRDHVEAQDQVTPKSQNLVKHL